MAKKKNKEVEQEVPAPEVAPATEPAKKSIQSDTDNPKIGFYICDCGINIAGVLDNDALKDFAATLPNVTVSRRYKFMCSTVGQQFIQDDIKNGLVDHVVVAACSPRMHEPTFRRALDGVGLNKFLFEQANIREHCSWVNMNTPTEAMEVAKDHIRMLIAKVARNKELEVSRVKVDKNCLIIGGGVAGMNTALDLANGGYGVTLVEKEATIGGHMAQLDKTFPTMDCSACILTPRMADVGRHPNIKLMTNAEVESVEGYVGNFDVTIRQKATFVDNDKCTGCGACADHCPAWAGNEFDLGMQYRKAIYIPFPQAVPTKYVIDGKKCVKCGVCARPDVCEPLAINLNDTDKFVKKRFGTIVISTGYKPFDPTPLLQYGYGKYENVITGLQMERLLSSFGPCLGKPLRPSDLKAPHSIVFVQCVGSRSDREVSHPYCSRVCCMYALKQARQYKEKHPDANITIFYMDIRAFGKGYEEFYEICARQYGINFVRGRLAEITKGTEPGSLFVRGEDTLMQQVIEMETDMVVLSVGLEPQADVKEICAKLSVQQAGDGFFLEAHPKLRPVDTLTDGIFIAGVAAGPKDIPDAVSQAKGAASSAAVLMSQGEVEIEPYYSIVDPAKCSRCKSCLEQCPFGAIIFNDVLNLTSINPAKCKGCGTCAAACPCGAITQNHFTNDQIYGEIEVVLPMTQGGKVE
ncbi:MAG TPA: CoB--CoM heterodisulfide reductase iron-sulfur subunit A family protein [Candidatus Lokiarchaeia archaeon]|nr:CoB--CoM heterodisulfide reductase iron-sulfur subunit A family protein [Candidatus Lokiarchaeia archaeon]